MPAQIEPAITHTCHTCLKETANYYLCSECIDDMVSKGMTIDELYERECDAMYASKGY